MPFELIQSGNSSKEVGENDEVIETPIHIQVEKIVFSDLGDIYILQGYQYAFPEPEYSYKQAIEYSER